MFVAFGLLFQILLVTMLIAMMANTYRREVDKSYRSWKRQVGYNNDNYNNNRPHNNTAVTEEPRESMFLFQRLSISLHRGVGKRGCLPGNIQTQCKGVRRQLLVLNIFGPAVLC